MVKKKKLKKILLATGISLLLLTIIFFVWSIPKLQVTKYTIDSPKLTAEVKVVVISDLHASEYGENQKPLISAIKKQNPDLILMTGDIIDETRSTKPVEILFNGIKNLCPMYFIYGNHEQPLDRKTAVYDFMVSYGVGVLEEQYAEEIINGQKINICGLRDPQDAVAPDTWQNGLTYLSDQVQDDAFTILLSHRPHFTKYYKQTNFDLILCGHEHGGQWRIPFINKGLYSPDEGLFPKYYGGKYDLGTPTMIVSRGLCKNYVPRFNNRPEIVSITLK